MAVAKILPDNDDGTNSDLVGQLLKSHQKEVTNLSRENEELRSDIHELLDSFAEQSQEITIFRAQEHSNSTRISVLVEELRHVKAQASMVLHKYKLLLMEKDSKSKGRCQGENQRTLNSRESFSGAVRRATHVFGGDKQKSLPRNSTFATIVPNSNSDTVAVSIGLKTTSASTYGISSRRSSAPRLHSNGELGDSITFTDNTSPQTNATWTKNALQRARNTNPFLASYQEFPSATTSNSNCLAETSEESFVADDTSSGDVKCVINEDLNARWGTCSVSSKESSDHNPAKDGCLDDSTKDFIPVEIQKFENQVLCPQGDVNLLESW
jgi:hypothetical protein